MVTFEQLSLHGSNRDTKSQAYSLLKVVDFEFLMTLAVTQKILAYMEGLMLKLLAKAADLTSVMLSLM